MEQSKERLKMEKDEIEKMEALEKENAEYKTTIDTQSQELEKLKQDFIARGNELEEAKKAVEDKASEILSLSNENSTLKGEIEQLTKQPEEFDYEY